MTDQPRPRGPVSRRRFLAHGLGLVAATASGAAGGWALGDQQLDNARAHITELEGKRATLRRQVDQLSYNTASGGGVNRKLMTDPHTGERTAPMDEVFSFDRTHAFCRVDTNPQAFAMESFAMGRVVVDPHMFFMAMETTSVDQFEITAGDEGLTVVMRGGLDCATEIDQTALQIGGRDVAEHATYRVEAVDGGIGGGEVGDRFAFTAYFAPDEAPVNHDVFGPEATFTGKMIAGEINITDPST